MTNTLVQDLDLLHAGYVDSVNRAIAADDVALAEELAAAYERDAVQLMAEHEGLTHLLPLTGRTTPSRLRGLVARLTRRAA